MLAVRVAAFAVSLARPVSRPSRALRGALRMSTASAEDAFELVATEVVVERNLTAQLFRHRATGAEVLSVDADDDNKVFSCNFRTLPKDDTGVPHILEHSVLCGSRKYPVKEPFVEMLKGSLKTFLNAMTGPDKTMYPVASQNKQDFLNLVDVYLDACLHPRVAEPAAGALILKQEGWHYEVGDGPGAPLSYKGVVFNEMKGVYSSPDQLHYRALKKCASRGQRARALCISPRPANVPSSIPGSRSGPTRAPSSSRASTRPTRRRRASASPR